MAPHNLPADLETRIKHVESVQHQTSAAFSLDGVLKQSVVWLVVGAVLTLAAAVIWVI